LVPARRPATTGKSGLTTPPTTSIHSTITIGTIGMDTVPCVRPTAGHRMENRLTENRRNPSTRSENRRATNHPGNALREDVPQAVPRSNRCQDPRPAPSPARLRCRGPCPAPPWAEE
jgi:hypothetical protein